MKKFRCYLIGKDNLLIECGKILLAHEHQILGVCSSSAPVKIWAHENNIPFIYDLDTFELIANKEKADYLFSIINDQVLQDRIIASPLQFSINYHDSLLPKYAGVHATSWAILNAEKQHGITWHIMEKGIDKGNILVQNTIDIDPEDTAFTLNLKCYSSAIVSFTHLVSLLANEAYCATPQNKQERTYYGLYKKPDNFGWIDWNSPASKIKNLIQALDFGKYENNLSTAKCIIGAQAFIVNKIKILESSSKLPSGTIIEFDEKSITLATQTQDICIFELLNSTGEQINLCDYLKENLVKVGSCLESFLPLQTEKNRKLLEKISKNEKFWLSKWLKIEETVIPFLPRKKHHSKLMAVCTCDLKKFNKNISKILPENAEIYLSALSLLLIYLARMNNKSSATVLFGNPNLLELAQEQTTMLSTLVPLTAMFAKDSNFLDTLNLVSSKMEQISEQVSFFNDLPIRHPEIKGIALPTIAIVLSDSIAPYENTAPMIFQLSDNGKSVHIHIQSDLLNPEIEFVLKNIPSQIEVLTENIVVNTQQSIDTLAIMGKKEKKQMIEDWNNTHTPYPKNQPIQQLFEEQVRLFCRKPAIVMEGSVVTYAELNNLSNQLAHFFGEYHIKSGQIVCIILERSIDLVVSILATLKSGGIYIPIDPDHPDERIMRIIKECHPKLCISHSKLQKRLSAYIKNPTSLIFIDKSHTHLNQYSQTNLSSVLSGEDIANIMYTSGSTGKPKGIQIKHRGIIRLVKNTNFVGVKDTDNVACIANPMFDASTFEIWSALLNGATLVIIKKEIINSIELLHKELSKNKVTVLLLTSAFFDFIVSKAAAIISKMDTLIVVGDVLNPLSVQKSFELNPPPRRIINGYGPTENTGATAFYEINALSDISHVIPIGKPVSNTTVYVCDHNNQLLPIGAIGELFTGGDGLAQGYVNQPQLTQEKFITNPFETADTLLYKTGDLVRWLPNGNLEYLGRSDNLVKIRGYRIELSEIEHALLLHPSIVNCCVAVNKASGKNKQLIAWIIAKEKKPLTSSEIKFFLSAKLPDYMLPSVYVFLEKFPLILNGKIDKEKLFHLLLTKNDANTESILPVNEPQLSLIKIWHHIFKQKNIGIQDNFFELGGDSIVAMQIQFEARQIGIHFTVKDIFSYPTIEQLTPHVDYLQNTSDVIHKKTQVIPFSPIQSWFFEQKFLNREQFSQYAVVEIKNNLSPTIIENNIQRIIEANDCFYLRFSEKRNKWTQHYSKKNLQNFKLANIDIIDVVLSAQNTTFRDVARHLQAQFELNNGTLFVGALIRELCNKKTYLLLVAHHLIFDGVSWRIFFTALDKACTTHMPIFNENKGFVDWSLLINKSSDKLEWQLDYYLNVCSKETPFKYDHEKGRNTESSARYVEQGLSKNETQMLHQITRQYQIRLDELLIAICVRVLSEWQDLEGVIIDVERHGRETIDVSLDPSHILGWFTSLFPMYFKGCSDALLKDFILDIKAQFASIQNNGIRFWSFKISYKSPHPLRV